MKAAGVAHGQRRPFSFQSVAGQALAAFWLAAKPGTALLGQLLPLLRAASLTWFSCRALHTQTIKADSLDHAAESCCCELFSLMEFADASSSHQ